MEVSSDFFNCKLDVKPCRNYEVSSEDGAPHVSRNWSSETNLITITPITNTWHFTKRSFGRTQGRMHGAAREDGIDETVIIDVAIKAW